MEILEHETGGHSYKSHKYSLDQMDRSPVEYGEAGNTIQWKRRGETDTSIKTYVCLANLCEKVKNEQLLAYFLDGSRHVYKVDDMGFEKSGNRTAIYPIVAGQIGVGCCGREKKECSVKKLNEK
jgi:hypothetical protein